MRRLRAWLWAMRVALLMRRNSRGVTGGVQAASYRSEYEARLAAGALQAHGIPATVYLVAWAAMPAGDARVIVHERDLERAQRLLTRVREGRDVDRRPEPP
jgi:NAD(P)H-dependent FMN reductase